MEAAWRVVSSTTMQTTADHDALAYRARTEAALLNAGSTDLTTSTLEDTLDGLWALRYFSNTLQPGFGIAHAFDAFGDGTFNPAEAIYSYTSATAALAYLDGHEILGGTTQLDRAKEIVDMLLTDCWGWSGSAGAWGCVWYSDHANDQSGDMAVNNTNALLLAALARIDRIDGAPYDATKRGLIETFTSAGIGFHGVPGRWRYRMASSTVNDLTHHAFMVLGVAQAEMATELAASLAYQWTTFFQSDGSFNTANSAVMGTNQWGPGDGLISLCQDVSWEPEARSVCMQIIDSIGVDGESTFGQLGNERSQCRYGLACATYAALIEGDGSLFPP